MGSRPTIQKQQKLEISFIKILLGANHFRRPNQRRHKTRLAKRLEKSPAFKKSFLPAKRQRHRHRQPTSQLLSNIYLDQLDRYIIYDLGYKHYGRYVDDFYFLVEKENLEKAKNDIKAIERYLTRLGLTLHPKKRYIQPVSRGVPFVGAVVYPGRIYPSKRLVKNFRTAVHEVATGRRDPESIASYLGHLKYLKSDKLITKVFAEVGWKYRR